MKILIVDDEYISRRLLQKYLKPYGKLDIVTDGEEAVHAFVLAWKDEPYDLICMDIVMPGVDGQEALRRIREMERDIGVKSAQEAKVIMITALEDPQNVIEAYYKGGANSYIVKPINKGTLMAEVRKLSLEKSE